MDLAYQLRATFRACETQLSRYLSSIDVAISTYYILRPAWTEAGKTQKVVAAQSDMTPSVASQLIKKLCKEGLLARKENPEDAREKLVFITPKGAALREQLNDKCVVMMADMCSDFSPEAIRQTTQTLKDLQQRIVDFAD